MRSERRTRNLEPGTRTPGTRSCVAPGGASAALLLFAATAERAQACSTCFGDPSSPLTQGAQAGMILLLGFTAFVLGSVAFVGTMWMRRARLLKGPGLPECSAVAACNPADGVPGAGTPAANGDSQYSATSHAGARDDAAPLPGGD